MKEQKNHHSHSILSTCTILTLALCLFLLTAITVGVSHIDLGKFNFLIAMTVATLKASLVALFFMNLKWDHLDNRVIFSTSFLFLVIFFTLTSTDLFFRGNVYVKGPLVQENKGPSIVDKPWISTPQLVQKGKELFSTQCVSCHGSDGKGDGPAAPALMPRPRNFVLSEGWKNGRKPSMVFKTLKEGIPGSAMAAYSSLAVDDRWALSHYVLSLGAAPPLDTAADLIKIGIDPTKKGGGITVEQKTIPIPFAMEQISVSEISSKAKLTTDERAKSLYEVHCSSCHGQKGEGAIRVQNIGVRPIAYVTTAPFKNSKSTVHAETFYELLVRGIPGSGMPGFGHLTRSDLKDLYQFVQQLSKTHQ